MQSKTALRLASAVVAPLLLALGAAAAPEHALTVDATARPAPAATPAVGYRIHSASADLDETTLRFREAARHIKTALSAHGFFEARDEASADFVVDVDYGVNPSPPKLQKRYAPIYSNDHRLHIPVPDPNDPTGWANLGRNPPDTLDDGSRLVGYSIAYFPITSTEKFLAISAHETRPAADGRPPASLWRVVVSLEDSGQNLRASLPLLAAAVMEAIGRNTDGRAKLAIGANDSAVKFINKGM